MAALIKVLFNDDDPWKPKRLARPFNPDTFPRFYPLQPRPSTSNPVEAVFGSTRFENYLAAIARKEFLTCVLEDTRVTSRFEGWVACIGLSEVAHDIADFLSRVAQRRGLTHRRDLHRALSAPLTLIQDLLSEGHRLEDRLYRVYRRGDEVLQQARIYVLEDFGQRWSWLAHNLTYRLFLQQWEYALGLKMRIQGFWDTRWALGELGLDAASSSIHWEAKVGESNSTVEKRVIAELRKQLSRRRPITIAPGNLKIGRVRQDSEKNMPRWTRWLYRDMTITQVRYQLASVYHNERQDCPGEFPSCPCQKEVAYGINRALEILNNTSSPSTEK